MSQNCDGPATTPTHRAVSVENSGGRPRADSWNTHRDKDPTMSRPRSRRLLLALAAAPLALALSSCSVGLSGGSSSPDGGSDSASASSQSAAHGSSESSASASPTGEASGAAQKSSSADASTVLGTWEGEVKGHQLRIDVNAVSVERGLTRLTLTATNTGSSAINDWMLLFGGANMLALETKLVDTANRMIYSPGVVPKTARCLCTTYTGEDLEPGASSTVYTTYTGLAEGVDAVDVMLRGASAPIADIAVTRG